VTDVLKSLPLRQRYEIGNAIRAGHKIEAIKLYREASGCDLRDAYSAIETLAAQLQAANPYAFKQQTERREASRGAAFIVLAVIGAVVFALAQSGEFAEFRQSLQQAFEEKPSAAASPQNVPPSPPRAIARALEETESVPSQPALPSEEREEEEPYRVVIPAIKETDIAKLYRQKLANPDYLRWFDLPGLPLGYQDYPEEHAIKYARAQIAAELRAPANVSVAAIPLRQGLNIAIDGVIDGREWQSARRLELFPQAAGSALYLLADFEWLYIACDVPGEKTEDGFDQLRFYFHVDIDPAIKNERIHLGRHDKRLGGIRETTLVREASPGVYVNSRRGYPISDWQIFRMARGATKLKQHRQYEAKIHLAESGLHLGVPFPVYVELETDPLKENGKFKKRLYLGKLGSQQQPVWLMIL
jgi:hypothetical protein